MDDHRTFVDVLRQRRAPCRSPCLHVPGGWRAWDDLDLCVPGPTGPPGGSLLAGTDRSWRSGLALLPPRPRIPGGFFGCLFADVIAVPTCPPRINRSIDRLLGILTDARPKVVLTAGKMLDQFRSAFSDTAWLKDPPWVSSDRLPSGFEECWREPEASGGDVAFLQYTSGSTRTPRGVMVTHANILANQRQIRDCFGHSEDTPAIVSWLPNYHDMGLVGNILHPIYMGIPLVQLSPLTIMQRPLRWLEAISRSGASTSGGPNFAYDLCVRRINQEQRERLDLSRWRVAFVGAEPVRKATLERFAEYFAPCGFDLSAFLPCYGMAETTLFVTGQRVPSVLTVSPDDLERGNARLVDNETGLGLVGSGGTSDGVELLIVDPKSAHPIDQGRVGEIWVRGPQVASGYWNNPEATAEAFGSRLADGTGPFLRTGDLGFLLESQVFVTGRIKELIIIDGRNLYPHDLEWTVQQSHQALMANAGAAFAIDGDDAERLVIVQELERSWLRQDLAPVRAAVSRALAEQHDVSIHDLVLVRPNTVPRTSSGKIQRNLCRQRYLQLNAGTGLSGSFRRMGHIHRCRMNRSPSSALGCRFPGAADPSAFWELLRSGGEAIRTIPPDRWDVDAYYDPDPEAAGRMNTRWGAFLDSPYDFDRDFFKMSAWEASRVDPQQRLLLELTWEALEDAGESADRWAGGPVGVFVGLTNFDYLRLALRDPVRVDSYALTGGPLCMAANRLSYHVRL